MAKNARHFRLNRLGSVIRSILGNPWNYACTAVACLPAVALAGPSGEQVVAGTAAVTRPNAVTTKIQQGTDKAIINWQSFSIGGQEYVQFTQPSPTAIALNRVVGGDPSEILGQLSANGRIFLVNPHGVYFGPGAQVDVNGLVASVLDIKDEDFMAGNYVFARTADNPDGAGVVNDGTIKTGDGGFVVLAGGKVDNSGLIEARMGTIALASGNRLTLTVGDTGLVDVAVDEKAVDAAAGVTNAGQLIADGGRVLMTAKVAQGLVTTAVNNEGLVQARSIQEHNGVVTLSASGGDIENNGTIDASGQDGQAGGDVQVTSDQDITLHNGSAIYADGDGDANGGTVTVIADGKLAFRKDALISAKAGSPQGSGGFVELSGHEGLSIRGTIALGKGGELLLDPTVLTIKGGSSGYGTSSISELFIENQLNSGATVVLAASNEINATGTFSGVGIDATGSGSYGGDLFMWVTGSTPTGINLSGIGINIRGSLGIGVSHEITGASSTGAIGHGNINIGNLTSQNGHVQVITQSGNLTVGNVSASGYESFKVIGNGAIKTGTLSAPNSYVEVHVSGSGSINVGSVTSGAYVDLFVGSSDITAGNIQAAARIDIETANGNVSTGNLKSTGAKVLVNVSGNGSINVGNVNAVGSTDGSSDYFHVGGNGNITTGSITDTSSGAIYVQVVGTGGINVGNINGNNTASIWANNGNVTTKDVKVVNSLWVGGNNITINGIMQARNGSSLGGNVYLNAGTSVTTGAGGRVEGHIQVDGFEGMPGPIDVSIATRSPNIQFGNSGSTYISTPKWMNVHLDNTAYGGAATVIFNQAANYSALSFGMVDLKMGGAVSIGSVSADALEVHAHGNISLGSVTVRSGALSGPGDTLLLDLMQGAGLPLPTSSNGNALFRSDGNIAISSLTLTDPYPYIAFVLNGTLSLGSLNMSGSEILAQFTASDPTLSIGVESLASTLQNVNFNKTDHFSKFPGTTIAVGVGLAGNEQMTQQGDIVIGANGPINLGTKNFICLTAGQCIGLDKVLTSGRVLSLADASLFNIPLPQEFNNTQGKKDKDLYTGGEGEGEGEGQSLVTQDSGSEKMCQ